jgi:hypothetical protein
MMSHCPVATESSKALAKASERYSEDRWSKTYDVDSLRTQILERPVPHRQAVLDSKAAYSNYLVTRWAAALSALSVGGCLGTIAGRLWFIAAACAFAAHLFSLVWLAAKNRPTSEPSRLATYDS